MVVGRAHRLGLGLRLRMGLRLGCGPRLRCGPRLSRLGRRRRMRRKLLHLGFTHLLQACGLLRLLFGVRFFGVDGRAHERGLRALGNGESGLRVRERSPRGSGDEGERAEAVKKRAPVGQDSVGHPGISDAWCRLGSRRPSYARRVSVLPSSSRRVELTDSGNRLELFD